MTSPTTVHTQGVVSDYFTIETHVLATRTADAFRAVDRSRQSSVTLWILRHAFDLSSPSAKVFLDRLKNIQEIHPPAADLRSFGVDASGVAFAVVPSLDGMNLSVAAKEPTEAERRFFSVVRLLERIQQAGVVCGDLTMNSFWLDRSGDIRFVGVMGSFDQGAAVTTTLPPAETLYYVAPEQVESGAEIDTRTDIYALGVIGYFLLSTKYPFSGDASELPTDRTVVPLSQLMTNPPVWGDEVLGRCLSQHAGERYENAGDIMRHIFEIRERSATQAAMPVRTKGGTGRTASTGAVMTVEPKKAEVKPVEQRPPASKKPLFIGLAGAAVLLLLAMVFGGGDPVSVEPGERNSAGPAVDADRSVQQAIKGLGGSADAVLENENQIEALVRSDDPIAHDTLVRLAIEANSPQTRQRAEKGIIDRGRRLGLIRCAEEARSWLQSVPSGNPPASYEPLLRSMDLTVPLDARQKFLRQAYVSAPSAVLRFTAALGFDSKEISQYQPLLAQLVGDNLKLLDAEKHSALALVLADPIISPIYADDVIQNLKDIPDSDIPWLLEVLSARKDTNIKPIANVAIDRNLVPPIRRTFAKLLRDRDNLPPPVAQSLVNAVAGVITPAEVARIGEWYDLDSERVLLAMMAESKDQEVLTEAFDTVAGKSLSIQPSAVLIDAIRQRHWDRRVEVARLLGMLAFPDAFSDKELEEQLGTLQPFVDKDPRFLDMLFESGNAMIVRTAMSRFSANLGAGRMLNLLGNPDKNVRLMAISRLKEYNQAQLLKLIISYYEKEKDPEVLKAYQESFWFIKERQKAF